jgi:hypothetical protein
MLHDEALFGEFLIGFLAVVGIEALPAAPYHSMSHYPLCWENIGTALLTLTHGDYLCVRSSLTASTATF